MFIRKLVIHGNSMFPTISSGDIVFSSPLPYFFKLPSVDDIVVCYNPKDKTKIVKRIIKIDKEQYYLLGDNTKESTDSRTFGPIERRAIIGKVVHLIKRKN